MIASEFIDALKVAVHDSAVSGVEALLHKPSGQKPAPSITEASQWFCNLKEEDQEIVRKIVVLSVHSGVFGLLAVLDGVRSIQDKKERGQLLLSFSDSAGVVRLNNPDEEMLHDIYQAKVYDEVFGERS